MITRKRIAIAIAVLAVPVLALAWWLGSPLFLDRTVDEEFPYSVGAVVPEGMTREQVETTMATMAGMDSAALADPMPMMTSEQMIGDAVGEAVAGFMAGMTPEMMQAFGGIIGGDPADEALDGLGEMMEGGMAAQAMIALAGLAEAMEAMPEMMAGGGAPVAVKRGAFRDADGFHRGEGSATVYELPDGSHVLRFEDFRVTNGPDLRVLLTAHPDPQGRSDVQNGEYVELGKLKGNVGNQNYPFPDDLSPDGYASVVIYCKPFQVVFSVAPLSE